MFSGTNVAVNPVNPDAHDTYIKHTSQPLFSVLQNRLKKEKRLKRISQMSSLKSTKYNLSFFLQGGITMQLRSD